MESYTGEQDFTGDELVQYACNNASAGAGTLQVGYYQMEPYQWYPWWGKEIHYWYPSISYTTERSKVEQAFKIVCKLLEKKIIKELNVKQFIELVNEIATII